MTELQEFIIENHTVDGDVVNIDDSYGVLRNTVSLMLHDKYSDVAVLAEQLIESDAMRELALSIILMNDSMMPDLFNLTRVAKADLIEEIERKIKCIDLEDGEEQRIFNKTESAGINAEFQ